MQSIKNLTLLHDCLAANMPIPAHIQTWLTDSLERWARGQSLPDAFGVFDNSKERKQRRDSALKDYASTLEGSTWAKAGIIAHEVDLLRQRRKCAPIINAIDQIALIPDSQRQIYDILKY